MNSPNHDCADIRQNLHLLLGGELDSALQNQTEQHLSACAACRAELEGARHSRELYLAAAVDADSEPLDLWPGIRSRLYSEQVLRPRAADRQAGLGEANRAPTLSLLKWRWAPVYIAAAAALLLMLPTLRNTLLDDTRSQDGMASSVTPESVIADPVSLLADSEVPGTANSQAARQNIGLRAVLMSDESLIERAQRLALEQRSASSPGQGSKLGGLNTHPSEPSLYDVVNQRRLR